MDKINRLIVLAYIQLVERHVVPSEASLATGLITVAIGLAIVIALGILMHRYVEVPARLALRRRADRSQSADRGV